MPIVDMDMQPKPLIVCDFDGTITEVDVTDLVLAQFAHPSWREVEQEWVRGSIGSRECLERQMALVQASTEELNALIDSIPIDAHFLSFYRFLKKQRIPFYIVTDGFDYIARRVLKRAGIADGYRNGSRLFASELQIARKGLRTSFPFSGGACGHGCATCKATVIRQLRQGRRYIIFIGDGLSDRFAAEEADKVFAKRSLLAHCQARGMACQRFETFADIEAALDGSRGVRVARRSPRKVPAIA